jgi:hypothetical protein
MTRTMSGWVFGLILVCLLAVFHGVSAGEEQRYINHNYGFSFPISQDMNLYTPDHPGPFTFAKENIFILANKWKPNEFIMVNLSAVTAEEELQSMKETIDSRGLTQPDYRKVAVRYTNIGGNQQKRAVEHIFNIQAGVPKTMRQICFVHKGKGFAFICTANADHFQEINQEFFDPFFRSITFE